MVAIERKGWFEFASRLTILALQSALIGYVLGFPLVYLWYLIYAINITLSRIAVFRLDHLRTIRAYVYVLISNFIAAWVYRSIMVYFWTFPETSYKIIAILMITASMLFSITQRSTVRSYTYFDAGADSLVLLFFASSLLLVDPTAVNIIEAVAVIGVGCYHWIVLRDIFETRNSLRDAGERNLQAQKMEALGRLTGGIAHDFNNILTVVMGNLDLYREVTDPKEKAALANKAHEAAARASILTAQLLAFSRQSPLIREQIETRDFIDSFTQLTSRVIPATIEFRQDIHGGIWDIHADRNQLENALLNLVINARDAMPEGGTLVLSAHNMIISDPPSHDVKPGPHVCLVLQDDGDGIPAEILDKVFDPFFTTKDVGKGSGLGLSMAKGFTEQSNGWLSIESEPDEGTSVKLLLPANPVNLTESG